MNPTHCFQRLAWMIWSPSRTFQALQENPTWLGPFLIIGLGTAVTTWLTVPVFQKMSIDAVSQSWSAEQVQRMLHISQVARYASTAGTLPLTLVFWFITALLIWLIVQVFEGLPSFKTIFAVVAHANVASLLSGILITALMLIKLQGHVGSPQDLEVRLGLDLFWQGGIHPALRVVLASFNPFSLWYFGLLILGTAKVCRFNWLRASGVIGTFWTLNLAFGAGLAWVISSLTTASPS